jgi:hypothetical protein
MRRPYLFQTAEATGPENSASVRPLSAGKELGVRIDRLLPQAIHSALQFLVAIGGLVTMRQSVLIGRIQD